VDNWKNITNSQNSVRKKSFGGTLTFSKSSLTKPNLNYYLELLCCFWSEFRKIYPTTEKNVGRFWNSINLPAKILKESGQSCLTCGLATTRSAGQHKFPDLVPRLLFLTHDLISTKSLKAWQGNESAGKISNK
jgi:hypothetical protein